MVKLTKEDLLLAAEAAEKWPLSNFNQWSIGGQDIFFKKNAKPGIA